MRFGAFVPQGWRFDLVGIPAAEHWSTMASVASVIERSGFESLWVYDHFHTVPVRSDEPTYEAWTMMSALAVATDTVRIGQMCTSNSYRPPAYLAKVAASIDQISGGRLEMGIGAGWYEAEYLGYGYEFPKPSVRIGQLQEGVEIMKALWTGEPVDYSGKYYTLEGAICRPRPLQQPHIPLWVAGGGEKLTLRVAARYGDYTNFGASVEEFTHKSELLLGHCRDVGRDFDEITRSVNFMVVCAETEAGVKEQIGEIVARHAQFVPGERAERIGDLYSRMSGTPEQIVEKLKPFVAAGMEYAIGYFAQAAYDTSGMELFAAEVIPALA